MNKLKDNLENAVKIIKESEGFNEIVKTILKIFDEDKKILICGNGGSATQSQHFAGELVGRFKMNRKALPAISIASDMCVISAIANDFGFEKIFEKQIEGIGLKGDVLFCLSTSGNSKNIIDAIMRAKKKEMKVISLLGNGGGRIKKISDISLVIPFQDTAKIQEVHLIIIHSLCEIIEKNLFGNKNEQL